MRYTPCYFCGKDNRDFVYPDISNPDDPHGFNYVYCRACGVAYLNPMPETRDIVGAYGHYADGEPIGEAELGAFKMDVLKRNMVRRAGLKKGERVLDIGSGKGETFYCLTREGYDVTGLEPFSSRPFVDEELNRRIVRKHLLDAAFPDESFSMAVMWHVLEHVADPLPFIKEIARIIKPGGYLVMSVPNFNTFQHVILKKLWPGFGPPEHLFVYTAAGLKKIFRGAGFQLAGNFMDPIFSQWMLKQSLYRMFIEKKGVGASEQASKNYSKAMRSVFGILSFMQVRSEMLIGKASTANLLLRKEK